MVGLMQHVAETEFAYTYLHMVPTIVSVITIPGKVAYGAKTVPLRLALETNPVLWQMPNGCMVPGFLHRPHLWPHSPQCTLQGV